jgi:ABC-type nitrate/sulfonate/bicarbonate transport system substrate-binding protein
MLPLLDTHANPGPGRAIRLGYVPLIDCAPIVVAREKGFFTEQGLSVKTFAQPGWATIRDKLVYGELDASQCLGPLALAIHHGVGTIAREMVVPLIMSANGNAITLSNEIPRETVSQENGLRDFLRNSWSKDRPLTLASVHRCSSHHALLLQWLAQQGLTNSKDAELVFIPPETMTRNLANGHIDGFCVGEPWNSVSLLAGEGWCAATSVDLSNGHPEKSLATTADLAREHPRTLHSLTVAILKACRYCQDPANRDELISLLEREPGLQNISEALANSLHGRFCPALGQQERSLPDFHIFFDPAINTPGSHAASWLRKGLAQSGLLPQGQKLPKDTVFRTDLFEHALAEVSEPTLA